MKATGRTSATLSGRIGLVSLIALIWVVGGRLPCAVADEIYSNTTGGGDWSQSDTWRGGVVPGAEDDAVIARDDVVIFDRNDDKQVTCHQLSLDPRSVLQFKTAAGPIVFCLGGPGDIYGAIKLDASRTPRDRHEFRLVSREAEERSLKFFKGAGLVVAGRPGLAKSEHNVVLRSLPPVASAKLTGIEFPDLTGIIDAQAGSMLDVQRADVVNVYLQGTSIDNTGAKVGERLNIVRNHFTGYSRLLVSSCDTALVAENLFERETAPALLQAALYVTGCPLAEIRGNTIRGPFYPGGITCYGGTDNTLANNLVENCPTGVYMYASNAMVRQLTIKNCAHGLTLTSMSGALEDVTIEGSATAYYHGGAAAQFTNLVIRDRKTGPNTYGIYYYSGPLTLLNCDIKPEDITWYMPNQVEPDKGKPRKPVVQSMYFLFAKLVGEVPPGCTVEVRTVPGATPVVAGAADLNVRNSPARVMPNRMTPLPKSLEPLVVLGWSYNADFQPVKSPEYQVTVLAPATAGNAPRKVLKTVSLTPQEGWYRANPSDKQPTVEISLP